VRCAGKHTHLCAFNTTAVTSATWRPRASSLQERKCQVSHWTTRRQ